MTLEITFCRLILFQKGVSFLKHFKLKIEIAKKFSVIKTDDVGYQTQRQKKREEKTFVGRKINKSSNNNENTKNKQTPTVPTPLPTQKL